MTNVATLRRMLGSNQVVDSFTIIDLAAYSLSHGLLVTMR